MDLNAIQITISCMELKLNQSTKQVHGPQYKSDYNKLHGAQIQSKYNTGAWTSNTIPLTKQLHGAQISTKHGPQCNSDYNTVAWSSKEIKV